MRDFVRAHEKHVTGVLNGFDRLVPRGTLRRVANIRGMRGYLYARNVLLKHFGEFANSQTAILKKASLDAAEQSRRPIIYLASPRTSKEDTARAIADRDGITEGLICVLKAIEQCQSFEIHRNREARMVELKARHRQGLALYHYWIDPTFGFMNARIHTWCPYAIQVCLDGREWLARRMDANALRYERRGNRFAWIEDVAAAQRLMDDQLKIDWPSQLEAIADKLDPARREMLPGFFAEYYWTAHQSEWASDVMFRDRAAMDRDLPAAGA